LRKETISEREKSLLEAKAKVTDELEANRNNLRFMPDIHQVKQEAEKIRRRVYRIMLVTKWTCA
jgi:hypothetical protein